MVLGVLYNVVHDFSHYVFRALCVVRAVEDLQFFVFALERVVEFL